MKLIFQLSPQERQLLADLSGQEWRGVYLESDHIRAAHRAGLGWYMIPSMTFEGPRRRTITTAGYEFSNRFEVFRCAVVNEEMVGEDLPQARSIADIDVPQDLCLNRLLCRKNTLFLLTQIVEDEITIGRANIGKASSIIEVGVLVSNPEVNVLLIVDEMAGWLRVTSNPALIQQHLLKIRSIELL